MSFGSVFVSVFEDTKKIIKKSYIMIRPGGKKRNLVNSWVSYQDEFGHLLCLWRAGARSSSQGTGWVDSRSVAARWKGRNFLKKQKNSSEFKVWTSTLFQPRVFLLNIKQKKGVERNEKKNFNTFFRKHSAKCISNLVGKVVFYCQLVTQRFFYQTFSAKKEKR